MAYAIFNVNNPFARNKVAEVASIEAAREWIAERFEIVAFDGDDENNAADCFVKTGDLFAIEPQE